MTASATSDMKSEKTTIRCAIYTRKSTDEGLDREFNSLDAQRESAEAYIASQQHEGWFCLPDRYDDGGYTGGNMDRPALQRLLEDTQAGKIDCIVVYKVDRLSRSLMDFSRLVELFDEHGVSFVSVTQQFNTTSSMGRLTLNILLSFAQFEREIISERTRDKMAATRRKGKWSGGHPILGYDVVDRKLVINETEAACVRQIFELYLEHQSLIATIQELNRRGWTTKRWTTKKGGESGGRPFDKGNLHCLLTNVLYIGQVRYKDEVHPGEHQGIVDPVLFQRVQALLQDNARTDGTAARSRFAALLTGLLRCVPCNCSMPHTHTVKRNTRYRYYVCLHAQKQGWSACPSQSVPAPEIERFVIDQIRGLGTDTAVPAAATTFDPVWESLSLCDQARILRLLVERVDYDGRSGDISITLHPTGLTALTAELAAQQQKKPAK
jgi:site-specific DNA recombinase